MRIGASIPAMAIGATLVAAEQMSFGLSSGVAVKEVEDAAAVFKRVDVSIGVMSRCPDALFFENAFARTLEKVNKKINLSLNFIATRNISSSYQATCKHGEEECQGNIHQLCIIDALTPSKAGKRYDLSPSDAQRLWWDFVQCENYVGGLKRIGEESLAKQCVNAIGGVPHWEKDGLKECIEGPKGIALLRESIKEVERRKITNSATLQIEGKTVCVRDGGQWKDCSKGHETYDWVSQIEKAYEAKNPSYEVEELPTLTSQHLLHKRQGPPPNGNGTTTSPPPSQTSGNDNNQQGAPLSVFAIMRRLLSSYFRGVSTTKGLVPSKLNLGSASRSWDGKQEEALNIHWNIPSGKGSLLLQPRQSGGGGGNNVTTNPNANNFFGGSSAFPTPYLAFGITAIALFVLVVSFVLLRIFVRNRRLRRLGIYPEGPIDRLLGGNIREYEDTLAPPRLWEAKFADSRAGKMGADARAEKSALGGGVGAGDVKQYGWDALMPVSAALPPNLYPVIYEANETSVGANDAPPTYPPPPHQHAARLVRHMLLRRPTSDGTEGTATGSPPVSAPFNATPDGTAAASAMTPNANSDRNEEKLAASVNVTVLIAMPSPRTIFPSSRRLAPTASATSLRNPRQASTLASAKLEEVEEDDQDGSSLKGKAKRAPSLRSVKSTTSVKSIAEARREAFFGQIQQEGDDVKAGDFSQSPIAATNEAPPYKETEEEEEEELPELMFGTASVPIFSRLSGTEFQSRPPSMLPMSKLTQPNRSEILSLMSCAAKARERKFESERAAAKKMKKQEEGEGELEGNGRSVGETSIDGEGRSAILGTTHDRSLDESTQSPVRGGGVGDAATRTMMMTSGNSNNNDYEMNEMGSSRNANQSRSFEVSTPNTLDPLLYQVHPPGATSINHEREEEEDRRNLSVNIPSSPSAYTANEGTMTPTNSMPLTASDSRRYSIASWHTGNEDDAQAARAIADQNIDIVNGQRH